MAVYASIIFEEPAHLPLIDLVSSAEDHPLEAIQEVAAVLEHQGYPDAPLQAETAEKAVATLLSVVTALSQQCWREGDGQLFQAAEAWLAARGLS
jgi:hypothetical protein